MYQRCLLAPDRIAVLAPRVAGWQAFDAAQPFPVRRWPSWGGGTPGLRRLWQTVWPFLLALRWRKEEEFAHIECGQALPFGLVAVILSSLWRVPYDVWAYGDDLCKPARHLPTRLMLRFVLRRARRVWAISEATRAPLLHLGVQAERTRVLHPWPERAFLTSQNPLEKSRSDAPLLLMVARLEARKGVQEALRALALVQREVPTVRGVVVGEGAYRRELERLRDALGLRDHVSFRGSLADLELAAAYRSASLLIFTPTPAAEKGEREGFGMVCVEAGACGCPVVAWSSPERGTGGVAEAVLDGQTGLVVPHGDVAAVAAAVVRLLRDPALAARLGEGGRQRAEALWKEASAAFSEEGIAEAKKGDEPEHETRRKAP